MEDNLGFIIN